ncbi:hypothetical protein [Companilactobacillus halodurans]|nr:hypothetical protein [Companilactobacillus halodurans]
MQERKLHRKNETKQWRVIQQQELKKLAVRQIKLMAVYISS